MQENVFLPLFDYGSINEDHKKAATEIANIIEKNGNEMLASFIRHRFSVVEPKKYDLAESIFIKSCKENNIPIAIQGYLKHGDGPDAIHYPLVCINEDVRTLDSWFQKILK